MATVVVLLNTGLVERKQVVVVRLSVSEPSPLFATQVLAEQTGVERVVTIGEASACNRHVEAYQQVIDRECYFTLEPILLRRGA